MPTNGRPWARLGLALGALSTAVGCAHQGPRAPRSLAIAPVDTVGVAQPEAQRFERALVRAARKHPGLKPTDPARVHAAWKERNGPATTRPSAPCLESDRCLAALGRRLSADLVLGGAIAGLGELRMLRMRLVRTEDGMVVQDLQQTTRRVQAPEHTAADLLQRLVPQPEARALTRRWWFWSAVAAVVSASVGVGIWAASRDGNDRDSTVVHVGDL